MNEIRENDIDLFNETILKSKVQDFQSLLQQIENLNDKKKKLWIEIYENAILDRHIAYSMFLKLSSISKNESTEHAVHGRTMSGYIERMSKSNEQLIKLAELISKSEEKEGEIDPDDIFQKIKGAN